MTDTSREAVGRLRWGRAEKSGMNLQASCPFGNYYIALRGEYGWMWWRPASGPAHMGLEPTEDRAKAAAQADYEQRILAALNPDLLTRAETAEARLAEAVEGLREIAGMGVVCASDHAVRTLAKIKGENQ